MLNPESNKNNDDAMLFGFDLEENLKSKSFREKVEKQVDSHIELIQKYMREGGTGDDFKHLQTLMQGYIGLQKVMARVQLQHIRRGDS